jgi:hypothetical protein
MDVFKLLPLNPSILRVARLLWSKQLREKFDFRREYEKLFTKTFLVSTNFDDLASKKSNDRNRQMCLYIMIFQFVMTIRLWIMFFGFYLPFVKTYLGHYYLSSGKEVIPFILSQALVCSYGTYARWCHWNLESKHKTGFITNFVRDAASMNESKKLFVYCFFLGALNPGNVNVLGIVFRVFMVIKTLNDTNDYSCCVIIILLFWLTLAAFQVTFYGHDCSLGAITCFLACEFLVLKVKRMRSIVRQLGSMTRNRHDKSESIELRRRLMIRLKKIHESLIKNLLEFDPIQNEQLLFLSVNSVPTLGSMLYTIVYGETNVIFSVTYIMFFVVVGCFVLACQMKASHLRYSGEKLTIELHQIQAESSVCDDDFLTVGDRKAIRKIIENVSCPEKPLGFTAFPDLQMSFFYVLEQQMRNLSFFLLISSILRI